METGWKRWVGNGNRGGPGSGSDRAERLGGESSLTKRVDGAMPSESLGQNARVEYGPQQASRQVAGQRMASE